MRIIKGGDNITLIFFYLVVFGIPIVAIAYAIIKKAIRPLILGILTFIISQILIRQPLLSYIGEHSINYQIESVRHPLLNLLFFAFTAGVVEEVGRWIAMRFFLKKYTLRNGIIFGLGHGSIEALIIVGIPVISSIQVIVDTALYFSTFERLFTILIHISLSLLVMYGVSTKRIKYLIAAISIHTAINYLSGFLIIMLPIAVVELLLAIVSILLFLIAIQFMRRKL